MSNFCLLLFTTDVRNDEDSGIVFMLTIDDVEPDNKDIRVTQSKISEDEHVPHRHG